ncbi:MAG TPA: PAS domain S-box protein [Gemmatimonadales bacterium]|nr:PAS domain S-box protein [Gemmatimonadales bacterium]
MSEPASAGRGPGSRGVRMVIVVGGLLAALAVGAVLRVRLVRSAELAALRDFVHLETVHLATRLQTDLDEQRALALLTADDLREHPELFLGRGAGRGSGRAGVLLRYVPELSRPGFLSAIAVDLAGRTVAQVGMPLGAAPAMAAVAQHAAVRAQAWFQPLGIGPDSTPVIGVIAPVVSSSRRAMPRRALGAVVLAFQPYTMLRPRPPIGPPVRFGYACTLGVWGAGQGFAEGPPLLFGDATSAGSVAPHRADLAARASGLAAGMPGPDAIVGELAQVHGDSHLALYCEAPTGEALAGAWVTVRGELLWTLFAAVLLAAAVLTIRARMQRRRVRELAASEALLAGVIHSGMDAIVVTDAERRITLFNESAETIFRMTAAEALGRPLDDLLPALRRLQRTGWPSQAAHRDGSERTEQPLVGEGRRADGTTFQAEVSPSMVWVGGRPVVCAIIRDVTRNLENEAARAASEARLRDLVENEVFGVARITADGRIEMANRALAEQFGYASPDELIGLEATRVFSWPPADYAAFLARTRPVGRFAGVELASSRKDGRPLTLRLAGRARWDAAGAFEGMDIIVEDVTERLRLETRLRQSQKLEIIGQLAGGIAHDFNNLLTVFQMNLGLLEPALPTARADVRARLDAMRGGLARGGALVRKLLATSRREQEEWRPLMLNPVVSDLVDMLRQLLPEHVMFAWEPGDAIPMVRASVGAVEEILLNLVTNARDAMPSGGTLQIRTRHEMLDSDTCQRQGWGEPGNFVELVVEDTGVGIPPQIQAVLFEPFVSTKPPGAGAGLGLSMVNSLMRSHGGFVHVTSAGGLGTTVSCYFPVSPASAETQPAAARGAPAPGAAPWSSGGTILFVEDEPLIREAAGELLRARGYSVTLAAHGQEALAICEAQDTAFDLVVCDVIMPQMGGPALFRALRDREILVPFLFVSGYAPADEEGYQAVAAEAPMLQKPWTPDDLLRAIGAILRRGTGVLP